MSTRSRTLLASAGATALLIGTGVPAVGWATCTPGTFSGATETCTGTDTAISATLSGNQTVNLQGDNVTTGGVQLTATGATSINLTINASAATPAVITPSAVTPSASVKPAKQNGGSGGKGGGSGGGGGSSPPPPPPPPTLTPVSVVNASGDAIDLTSAGGNLTVTTGPDVTVSATGASGYGIDLQTSGSGAISLSTSGNVSAIHTIAADGATTIATAAGTAIGALLANSGSGAIIVNDNASTNGEVSAISSGGGAVTVNVGGNVTLTGVGLAAAISAQGGDTKIVVAPNVTISSDYGSTYNGTGIVADGEADPVEIDIGTGSRVLASDIGINVDSNGGDITVNSAGVIGSSTSPPGRWGILAEQLGDGGGNVNVNITGGSIYSAGAGIEADNDGSGAVTVTTAAGTLVEATIWAKTTSGAITVNNAGKLTSIAGDDRDVTVDLSSGAAATIDNAPTGVIDGQIFVQNGEATVNNSGIWDVNGISTLGANDGLGVINNTGLVQVGLTGGGATATSSSFSGLSAFNNGSSSATGILSMENGVVGDTLTVNAPFVGAAGHSELYLDAYLGGPGSAADELILTHGSSGQTLIRLFNTNMGKGAVNSQGIVLVTGATSTSNFALDPKTSGYNAKAGGIEDGLFLYSLQFQGGDEELIGTAGAGARQTPRAMSAGQQIFQAASIVPDPADSGGGSPSLEDRPRLWMREADGESFQATASHPVFAGFGMSFGEQAAPLARTGASSFDTSYNQGVATIVGGVDLVRGEAGQAKWSLGVATGYVESQQDFSVGADAYLYSGDVFGVYGTYEAGGLRIDATVKSDVLKAAYESGWLGWSHPTANLTSTGAEVDASYVYPLGPHLRLEPIGQVAVERTTMSNWMLDGNTVSFDPSLSGWANVGVRLSGEAKARDYRIKASALVRLWDEFGAANTAYITAFGAEPFTDRIAGVSGEVGGQVSVSKGERAEVFLSTSLRSAAVQGDASAAAGFKLRW